MTTKSETGIDHQKWPTKTGLRAGFGKIVKKFDFLGQIKTELNSLKIIGNHKVSIQDWAAEITGW
jgi:hypothetical protein